MTKHASRSITAARAVTRSDRSSSISITCGIVAVVTCCFSINLVTDRYENAKEEYVRARYIIEQTKPALIKTKKSLENKNRHREQTVSFI